VEIPPLFSEAITKEPTDRDRIIEGSIAFRPEAADILVRTAVEAEPTAASRIAAAAMRGLYKGQRAQQEQTVQQEPSDSFELTGGAFGDLEDAFDDLEDAFDDLRGAIGDLCDALGDAFGIECPPTVVSPSS
jgi:hypothetical protein